MGTNARVAGTVVAALAEELRVELTRQDLTVRKLAEVSGVPYTTVQRSLKGARSIDVEELQKMCDALGVRSSELFRRAEKRGIPTQRT